MSSNKVSKTLSLNIQTWNRLWEMAEETGSGIPEMMNICVKKTYEAWKVRKQ